jgi:hypothetical protein
MATLQCLTEKVVHLNQLLSSRITHRQIELRSWLSKNLITPHDSQLYYKSQHVKKLSMTLKSNKPTDRFDAVHIRDHLMFIITMGNACRTSNLINATVADVMVSSFSEEFNAYVMESSNYKTSLLYGSEQIILGKDLHTQFINYINTFRPLIINDAVMRSESSNHKMTDKR